MKYVKYFFYKNTFAVKVIDTNFYKHNQELFQILFRMADFSEMQEFVSVSQKLFVLLIVEQIRFSCSSSHVQVVKR